MEKIRVMVVDDHEMVRRGICAYLETEDDLEVVGEAASGQTAVVMARELKPDVILMDLVMEDGTGVEASERIKRELPEVQIIILTSYIDENLIFPALEAGALSYLLKTSQAHEIADAIRLAVKREAVIEPKVATKMLRKMRDRVEYHPHNELTSRELEVLVLIGEGKTNQEIADELFIGIKTVKTHVSNVLSKLGVEDRTKAAVYAHRNNLV
ncbi:MAG: response regulator transcription factor [Bacillota bacterium]|jgi:NarL family two-component system response regulator LiaR|nr:response regulator transcription factor [Bacillota bacterium]HHT91875.1 response regulator transcription factor [Bacillota bacterium]